MEYTFANSPTNDNVINSSSGTTSMNGNNTTTTTSTNNNVGIVQQPANSGNNGGGITQRPPSMILRRKVSQIDTPIVKTGIIGASSNLVNAIVGAGIIGIPYSIKQSGFVAGTLLLLIVGYVTHKSLRIIVDVATFHPLLVNRGVLTYEDLMLIPFGTVGKNFILINMLIMAYGAMIAYLLIIKDTIPTVLGFGETFIEREITMLITSLVIVVPLSMMRDISQLSFTSCLSVVADIVLVLIVVLYSPYKSTIADAGGFGTVIQNNWINNNLFIGLGVISTAMACQHSAFLISGTLENHTSKRWSKVTSLSLSLSTALTLILGIFGYLGFLSATQGDILLNFENETSIVNIGRLLLAITMFLTYPMESFVARHVIIQLVYNGNMDNTTIGPNGDIVAEQKYCCGWFGRREIITLGIYICTLLPALVLKDLGPVLSITGALGASCIAYIAPGLVYIGMNGTNFIQWVGAANISSNKSSNNGTIEMELPVVRGTGSLSITDPYNTTTTISDTTTTTGSSSSLNSSKSSCCGRPWYWYLVGMPLWVYIASRGENGIQQFFQLHELGDPNEITTHPYVNNGDHTASLNNYDSDNDVTTTPPTINTTEIIGPTRINYILSIFFIIFGIIAAVAGLTSNIWSIVTSSSSSSEDN